MINVYLKPQFAITTNPMNSLKKNHQFYNFADLCNLCDLCVDVEKRIDLEECSTFCSVGKEECKATLAGGRDLCPKCGVPIGPAPVRYTFLG